MHFQLKEATTEDQFGKMFPTFWEAYSNPRNPGREMAFPVKGDGPDAVAEAIEDCRKRMTMQWKNSNNTCHCMQVLDRDNDNAIVGAALWNVYDTEEKNPYVKLPKNARPAVNVDWWPEGSTVQKFTKMAMEQALPPRFERQRGPHLYLGMCCTGIKYRRHGVARLLMEWGIQKADELGIECFLSATNIGLPLYKNFGFLVIDRTDIDMTIPDPSEEWKELERKYLPYGWTNMWRPMKGEWDEGAEFPWEGENQSS